MPSFMELPSDFPSTYESDTVVISTNQQMEAFLDKLRKNTHQYDKIYIHPLMLPAMKQEAEQLPEPFKQAFFQQYPKESPTLVGFELLTESLTDRAKQVAQLVQHQDNDDELEASYDMLEGLFGDEARLESSRRLNSANEEGSDNDDLSNVANNTLEDREDWSSRVPTNALEDLDDDEFEPLLESQSNPKPILRARDAARANEAADLEPSRSSTHFLELDDNDMALYETLFNELPYETLAELISQKNSEISDMFGQSRTQRFKNHVDNILPIVAFAVAGARQEWMDAEGPIKDKLFQKMESFEAIFKLIESMRVLANNKSRFTEDYFYKKLEHILNQMSPGMSHEDMNAHPLTNALRTVASEHLSRGEPSQFYQHKKGSTAFDPELPTQEIRGHQKRLKIEHQRSEEPGSAAVVVTGKFDYSRKAVIGVQTGHFSGVKKLFAQRKDQLSEMNAQVRDFVTVALNDYKKGTPENPIYLQPSNGNQSELSLAILLEFKRRAILEGKVLIASDDAGKRIKITPDTGFSEDEKKYFSHFAMQVPKVKAGGVKVVSADQTAAYQLFKEVEVEGKKPLKDRDKKAISADDLIEVMTSHLEQNVEKSHKVQREMISEAVKPIKEELSMNPSTLRSSI